MNKHANIEDTISGLRDQIETLRSEAEHLSSSILPNERDLYAWRRRARHLYRDASSGLRDAGRYGRRESAHVGDLIRKNPGTASTATLAAAGLIGLGIWWLLKSDR